MVLAHSKKITSPLVYLIAYCIKNLRSHYLSLININKVSCPPFLYKLTLEEEIVHSLPSLLFVPYKQNDELDFYELPEVVLLLRRPEISLRACCECLSLYHIFIK